MYAALVSVVQAEGIFQHTYLLDRCRIEIRVQLILCPEIGYLQHKIPKKLAHSEIKYLFEFSRAYHS